MLILKISDLPSFYIYDRVLTWGDIMQYYTEIKTELVNNEAYKKIKDYSKNRNDFETYYKVGKLLFEAGKHYGEGIIKEYSKRLTAELGKGYSKRNLWMMVKFYNLKEKMQTLSAQLSWSHYCELLSIEDENKINYYVNKTINHNLSVRDLRKIIKDKEYERLPLDTKNKLIKQESIGIKDLIKNPIVIQNTGNNEIISEKTLQNLILENMSYFLKELGDGFTYIDNEYKIKLGDRYNYIDLFLYNIKYKCYVVVELKITELKKEYIGQIQTYMNYIDKNLKTINEDNTIGIIICRKDNKFVMEYCSDQRIYQTTYLLK